jgi:hypothetical protein
VVPKRAFLASLVGASTVLVAMRTVLVGVLGFHGTVFLLVGVPGSVAMGVLAARWSMGVVLRQLGVSYRLDPIERLILKVQLRRQLRQLER